MPDYVRALCSEIRRQKPFAAGPVHSVYFGGGTPSRLELDDVGKLMDAGFDRVIMALFTWSLSRLI